MATRNTIHQQETQHSDVKPPNGWQKPNREKSMQELDKVAVFGACQMRFEIHGFPHCERSREDHEPRVPDTTCRIIPRRKESPDINRKTGRLHAIRFVDERRSEESY